MWLWNHVHIDVDGFLGIPIHVWELLALLLAVAVAIIAIVHHFRQKRREEDYEARLEEMATRSRPWDEHNKENEKEEGVLRA